MKISLTVLLLAVCGALAGAQAPAQKKTAAAVKTTAVETAAAPKAVKPAPAKPAEEAEESVVMIDSRGDAEEGGYSAGSFGGEQEEVAVPGGLPSSYGQCKGVITEAGRSVLVFESPDDGSISLVQLVLGKGKASWKLLDRIPRSND